MAVASVTARESARSDSSHAHPDAPSFRPPPPNLPSDPVSVSPLARGCWALGLSLTVHLAALLGVHPAWIAADDPVSDRSIVLRIESQASTRATRQAAATGSKSDRPNADEAPPSPPAPSATPVEPVETPATSQRTPEEPPIAKTEPVAPKPVEPAKPAPPVQAAVNKKPEPASIQTQATPKVRTREKPSLVEHKTTRAVRSSSTTGKRRDSPRLNQTGQSSPKRSTSPNGGETQAATGERSPSRRPGSTTSPASATTSRSPAQERIDAAPLSDNPRPRYPLVARQRGQQGRVVLRVTVSAGGQAENVEIKTSSGYRLLDQAALKTVKSWRFRPARQNGQAVGVVLEVPVAFRLDG